MTLTDAALCIVAVLALLAAMAGVRWSGERLGWSAELQRKLVHVATGLTALGLPLLFDRPWPVVVLMTIAVVVMLVLRHPALARHGIGKALHGVERRSYGEILLAASVGLLFFRSAGQPVLFVLPILILTISDAAAALVGVRYGTRTFKVERGTKSLEGSAIFFLVTWIIAMVSLLLLSDVGRGNVVLLSLSIAAFATLVEADSWSGFDNLFVPVGVHLFLASYMNAGVTEIAAVVMAFAVLVTGFTVAGPRLGLEGHASRAYAVLTFLILSVTAVHNAVLPLAAIAAHIHARRVRPGSDAYADLDLIAAITLIGLFWLAFGEWHGHNAINLFNLTFAALAYGLLSTARVPFWPHGAVAGIALATTVLVISYANFADARWYGALWPWVIAALALSWIVPRAREELFDAYRSLRLSSIAISAPLALYLATLVLNG